MKTIKLVARASNSKVSMGPSEYQGLDEDPIHAPKHKGDVGYDLCARETTLCKPGEITWVPTGVHIEAKHPYWYTIAARSGLVRQNCITAFSVLDSDYQGELSVPLLALKEPVLIQQDTRFAQVIFMMHIHPYLVRVEEFIPTNRGAQGYGSTGR